ncbi:hypothetical protein N7G274_006427 [Stereocaulon virgatum]|uniref:HORMA domain-containing protein n=1 Tax=Stereocaulon virgatum TaxID=373712 RepID=A0ABR4A8A2_9LECA
MSTILENRTSSPQRVNNLPIRERQAFAMIQMLLRVSISSIAQLRNLFSEECFTYVLPSSIRHDSDILYDRMRGVSDSRRGLDGDTDLLKLSGNPYKVLTRGHSFAVNKLLDWLSIIFEAVLNNSLDGVQFSIYADKVNPSHVLESYTFSFQYTGSRKDAKRQLSGMAGLGPAGVSSSIGAARAGLRKMIDQIYDYHQILATLPAECYMMCHLFYSPLHSPIQQPTGFQECKDLTMPVPDNSEWHFVRRDFGRNNLAFYSVGLKIAFMAETEKSDGRSENGYQIPDNIICSRTLPRTFQLEKSQFRSTSATTQERRRRLDQSAQQRSSRPGTRSRDVGAWLTTPIDETDLFGPSDHFTPQCSSGPETTLRGGSAQLSVPIAETVKLTTRTKRSYDDSGLSHASSDIYSDEALIQTQVLEPRKAPPRPTQQARLLQAKEMDMIAKRLRVHGKHLGLIDRHIVRCQCGIDREEGPQMMQCACCGTWQHYHCYGFIIDQPREQHYCYQCLLEDSPRDRLSHMEELAYFRRALWIIYDREDMELARYTPKSFAQKLGCDDIKQGAKLIARLKNEGFLSRAKFPSAVRTPQRFQDRVRVYGDPFTSIGILYNLPELASAPKIQVEDVMPPRKHAKSKKVDEVAMRR